MISSAVPLITCELAREYQRRAALARRRNGATLPQIAPPQEPQDSATAPARAGDAFLRERLKRVRAQLDRIDAMLATETDVAKLDRLAAASSRLEEQERRLSDRSLPAVRRVSPPPARAGKSLLTRPAPEREQSNQDRAEQE